MRFASLGSGSRGNATLIESGTTRVLLDCGFSVAETQRRLARLGLEAEDVSAIIVTHEHGDHIGGVGPLARRFKLPVYLTHGTAHRANTGALPQQHCIDSHAVFSIEGLECQPYPVPHDAQEPVQFVFSDGRHRLGVLTDTGSITAHITDMLAACDALLLECNHDTEMLAEGPYPPSLKARVGGRFGHLSNAQAADLLHALDTSPLQHLVAMHLSDKNNTPWLARLALAEALGADVDEVRLADQDEGLDWCELI
jgi:phosphoribosyl 1,2-cyclic phosphodiesterase